MTKKTYPYLIKEGSAEIMARIIRYHPGLDNRINGKICRVTVTSYTLRDNLKPEFVDAYKNDTLLQVKLLGVKEPEYLVMGSMLEHLEDVEVADE